MRRHSGQALVEFAIASTVLFMLLLGLLDLGRVYYFDVSLHGAAREGARHGAWFDPGTNSNPYLYDSAIKSSVNGVLSPASLDATFPLGGTTTSCPTASDGNAYNNPPFDASVYPSALNSPYLYICYRQPGGGYFGAMNSAPSDNSFEQGDIEVILLMRYGLITGFLQPYIGQGIQTAAYAHFTVQGSQS